MTTEEIIRENRKLAEEYPFLIPKNEFTDKPLSDYDYSWNELSLFMPDGWYKRFGKALCKDLKEVLVRNDFLDTFRFLQVKEKYGQLRIYALNEPEEWLMHMYAWKYISEMTCVRCGAFPVPMRDTGWISPYCDDCYKEIMKRGTVKAENKEKGIVPSDHIEIRKSDRDGERIISIDMKPYYEMIGYNQE